MVQPRQPQLKGEIVRLIADCLTAAKLTELATVSTHFYLQCARKRGLV